MCSWCLKKLNCLNSWVIKGIRIKEEFFFSSRKFNTAELLKLLSNGSNKNQRIIFLEFRVGNSVELLELPSIRGKWSNVDRSHGHKETWQKVNWPDGKLTGDPPASRSSSSSTGLNYTLNSWNVFLWSLFSQLLPSSSSLDWVLVHWTHEYSRSMHPCCLHYLELQALVWVELPWTLKLFSPLLGSSNGATGFTTPKSGNLLLWSLLFPLLSSSSTSAVLKFLELKKNSSFILVPLITREFKLFSFFKHHEHLKNYPMIQLLLIPV